MKKKQPKKNSFRKKNNIKAEKRKPSLSDKKRSLKNKLKTAAIKHSKHEKAQIKKSLLDFFAENPNKTWALKKIFKNLAIQHKQDKLKTVELLEELLDEKLIQMNRDGNFKGKSDNIEQMDTYQGIVDFVNPRYAFIVCEALEEDVWVNESELNYAVDGDLVEVLVYARKKGKKPEGEVIKIIERKTDVFVGKIEISEKFAFVVADSRKMHLDIFIPIHKIGKARHGEKVFVKITKWHTQNESPTGEVIKVLGKAGENETEMHAILAEFGLPLDFPAPVLEEAKKIRNSIKRQLPKRRDMREILTFTIDPRDAKDFDDALSIQKLDNGNWEIGIHIADVTHYVKPDSQLEKEAYKRATSVYLVDRVIPMLPERLSNGLCSLRPNEDKLTFSAIFEIDKNANIKNEWFGRTVIHSDRRFAYEEAQDNMDTQSGDYFEELTTLNNLAKKLKEKRFVKGAINFESTEVRFKLDKDSKPIGIHIKERKDAHKLIEEFMLLANKKVAEFVYKYRNGREKNTMVYRTHDNPDPEKLKNFSVFAQRFGYQVKVEEREVISESLNTLFTKVHGTAQQNILESLAIRTMAKAIYSTEAIGHFGLAFEHYSHFTSPIRRYPDMMVHRLLQQYLDENTKNLSQVAFEKKCKHSTDMERRAAEAERASIKYKQVEFMQSMEDKVYAGVVTGVTEWGIYVEITETKCEGMVRMTDLTDDFYELDAENYRVIGKKSKRIIAFGDEVKVKVKDTNLEKRTMDLYFIDE